MLESNQDTADTPEKRSSRAFSGYVVAIGASAGGLDALERLFQELPADLGAAYVIVQHLSPDHKSMMANLLGRRTRLPVATVEDGVAIEADHAYLIPPGTVMTIDKGRLYLSPKQPGSFSLPIDRFFNSLADEYTVRAIGVVLSGTGSDGTRGGVAINEAGGFLLAQDPETAKFDGMPRSVIATGLVDDVLSPEGLAKRIVEHVQHRPRLPLVRGTNRSGPSQNAASVGEILQLLEQLGGVNFSDYKPATVVRRIERRMQVRHIPDCEHYLQLLAADRAEVLSLRREILIPVTSFFRDDDAFEELARAAIEPLVDHHRDPDPLRIWVPGTSTGEEAYSIAILFAEAYEHCKRWPNFKIFATDVEQQNIDAAGAGIFSEGIANELAPGRLERYFDRRTNHFVVKSDIRQRIVFARHNLLEDPPFTRIDLVSCRNLLIYLQPAAQERALRRIQYALAPGGILFLGASESVAGLEREFSPVSTKYKVYKILRHLSVPLEPADSGLETASMPIRRGANRGPVAPDAVIIDAGHSLLLRQYAPPSILVSGSHDLLHIYGDCQRYLRFSEGTVSVELAKLLPMRLSPVAQALLHKAAKDKTSIRSDALQLDQNERIHLIAQPIESPVSGETNLLLSFVAEPLEGRAGAQIATLDASSEANVRIEILEQELGATRESLQATIEELETANEELQAANEELMASNEELQSSNEELQSVNEELYTVNAETQEKIQILNRVNADLDAMAKAAAIATLFVDDDLRLTRFTPEASRLFKIRDTDIGRPIDDFANLLKYPDFADELRATLITGKSVQREVAATNGKTYLARLFSYSVPASDLRGAVAAFIDVTSLYDANRLQAIVDSLPEHLAVLDPYGTITLVNSAWETFARANGDPDLSHTGIGINYFQSSSANGAPDSGVAEQAIAGVRSVLTGESNAFSIQYPCHSPETERWFLMHAAPIRDESGGAVVSHIDITLWVQQAQTLGVER